VAAHEKDKGRFTRWLRRHALGTALCLAAIAVAALIYAVVNSPGLTLQYIQALRWPLAALVLVFFFRRPLTALLDRLERGKVATPFGSVEVEGGGRRPDQAAPAQQEPGEDPAGEVVEEHPELIEEEQEEAQDALADVKDQALQYLTNQNATLSAELDLYRILNLIFQAQLNFLLWVRAAPEGVSWEAVQNYYKALQVPDSVWATLDINAFTTFIFNNGLVEVAPNGNYRLSEKGQALLDLANRGTYAQKAF
jgi:hypothetical protein